MPRAEAEPSVQGGALASCKCAGCSLSQCCAQPFATEDKTLYVQRNCVTRNMHHVLRVLLVCPVPVTALRRYISIIHTPTNINIRICKTLSLYREHHIKWQASCVWYATGFRKVQARSTSFDLTYDCNDTWTSVMVHGPLVRISVNQHALCSNFSTCTIEDLTIHTLARVHTRVA